MTFDARAIKALIPGQHITSQDSPGLRLEATATKRTWVYRYRSPIDQALRQVKIGNWPEVSVHVAIVEWQRLRSIREAGRDPSLEAKQKREEARIETAQKKRAAKPYRLIDVANDYWEGHVAINRAKKGATEIRGVFDRMIGDAGEIAAAELTRAQAFDLVKRHADATPVQASVLRRELGAAWDYAIDAGRLPETCANWWRLILRGKVRSKGKKIAGERVGTAQRVLQPAEVGQLIRWLPNFTQLVDDALTLYLWTGTRGGEILTMEGSEVQLEDGVLWWTIPKAKTKNARFEDATDQRVPLVGRARSVVMRRKERFGDGLIFPARTRDGKVAPVEQKTIGAAVWFRMPYSNTRPEEKRARLPVTHWAPHDLRRTTRTLLASLGCPDVVGEAILGHMIPGVKGIYNKYAYDAERLQWLTRLSEYLESIAAP